MNKLQLKADKRELTGRKLNSLRKKGILPANIFGRGVQSLMIQIDSKEFSKVYEKTGETGLIEISVDGSKKPVLVHNIQKDPLKDTMLHVDFLQVDLKQKVTAEVPVEIVGESPAEKQGLGTVVQYLTELEVEALPEDLPEKFEVDASKLVEVDQSIYVKDISFDKDKVEIQKDGDEIIVRLEPQKEEVEVPVAPAETAAEGGEQPAAESSDSAEDNTSKEEK